MAQKSILSFFSKVPVKKEENSIVEDEESDSSPQKPVLKKKRRISSSSEEDESQKKSSPKSKSSPSPAKPNRKSLKTSIEKTPEKKNSQIDNFFKKDRESPKKLSPEPKKENITANGNKETDVKVEKETPEKPLKEEVKKSPEEVEKKEPEKTMKLQTVGAGQKGADYDPGKRNYHPIKDAFWKQGEKTPYLALAKTFEVIEETSSRLKMIEILSNYFRSVIVLCPNDLLPSVYLCLNQLAPAHEGVELGVAETNLMKAIAQTTGRSMAQIKADVQNTGDLGIVAEQSRSSQRMMFTPAPHTVEAMFNKIKTIANMSGTTAMQKKVDTIKGIFVACRHSEARFFIRSLAGKLRIGLAEQSVLQAIAQACALTPPHINHEPPYTLNALKDYGEATTKQKIDEISYIIKSTYCQCPDYNQIIPVIIKHGVKELPDRIQMSPGIPIKPMLAQPTKGVSEVLERFDGIDFTCEFKYDGERAQIHLLENGKINIYSRNQENNTSKYPDIIGRFDNTRKGDIKSCILDCEAVAWDRENKQILPFQILSTRKRKDANEADIKVQVCVYMFDLLYFNGKPLVQEPFSKRRDLLYENFQEVEGEWKFATKLDTNDLDELQTFLEESVKGNCEGLMVKTLNKEATYEIAKRSRNWLKLKKDYLSGVGDSLDLVVLGGYKGRGRRTGTYGGFLLGCYDQENEEYQSICKIGTGFSDEDLQTHTNYLKDHIIKEPRGYYRFDSSLVPDDWFDCVQVWEVKCADLSLSPVHRAALGIIDPDKGISLRFPRFIRIRDDKSVEDATSAQQVADMYSNQDQIKNQNQQNRNVEEDFY